MRTIPLLLLVCACSSEPTPAPAAAEHLVSAPAPVPAPSATTIPSAPTDLGEAGAEYLPNGNLVVTKPAGVWIFDGNGWKSREFAAETGITIERTYGSPQASLVVGNKGGYSTRYDSIELLSTADLGTLYRGHGRVVDGVVALPALRPNGQAPGANEPIDDLAVVLEHGGRLVTLPLPKAIRGAKEVTAVRLEGDLAIVSWQVDGKIRATAYALASGASLGSAAPHDPLYPIATLVGHVQYYIALAPPPPAPVGASGSSSSSPPPLPTAAMPEPAAGYEEGNPRRALVARDLESGQVLRQRVIPCKGQLANPTVSPDQSTVLVTCQDTAIVMDGRTLAERRRIAHVIPGCDNGLDLTGHIENGGTLVVEGCMGVARLNLGTGRYLCGDGAGVMGAPYEPMAGKQKFTKPNAPRCTAGGDDTSHQPIGSRGVYSYLFEEKVVAGPGKVRIQLEPDSSLPALSRAEDRLVYVNGGQLVVRELPSGKVLDLPRK